MEDKMDTPIEQSRRILAELEVYNIKAAGV